MLKINPQPLPLKLKCLAKPKSRKIDVSKSSKILFTLLLAIFSLDFGFIRFSSTKVNGLVKFLCVSQTSLISLYILYSFRLDGTLFQIWYSMYVFKYALVVFIIMFKKKSSLIQFFNDLCALDDELGIQVSIKLEFIILAGIGSCLMCRILFSVAYCNFFVHYCIHNTVLRIVFFIPILCVDTFFIIFFLIYYCLFNRLKLFTQVLDSEHSNIITTQYWYKSLVDIAENIKPVYNSLYAVFLFFYAVDILINVIYPLVETNIHQAGSLNLVIANAPVLLTFVLLFLPAYVSGLLASQVEQLQVVLHNRLLHDRDKKHSTDIERFIRYIEVRDLTTTIWEVIPLNWRLPVIFINFSVTYLIVMLQFTHKY